MCGLCNWILRFLALASVGGVHQHTGVLLQSRVPHARSGGFGGWNNKDSWEPSNRTTYSLDMEGGVCGGEKKICDLEQADSF